MTVGAPASEQRFPTGDDYTNEAGCQRSGKRADDNLADDADRPGCRLLGTVARPDRLPQIGGPPEERGDQARKAALPASSIFRLLPRPRNRGLDGCDDGLRRKLLGVTEAHLPIRHWVNVVHDVGRIPQREYAAVPTVGDGSCASSGCNGGTLRLPGGMVDRWPELRQKMLPSVGRAWLTKST